MKIFIINLKKDVERLKFAQDQALKEGVTFERIEGVYAAEMTKTELKGSVDYLRFTLRLGKKPGLGEIGCCLSHIEIYKKMIEENIPCACILEDDVFILEHFKEQLEKLNNWFDYEKPIVVRLNLIDQNVKSSSVAIRNHEDTSACSYCLTLSAAKALLKDNYPIHTVADDWPQWDRKGIIELYNSNPKVCWHNNAASGFNSTIVGVNNEEKRSKVELKFTSSIKRKILKGLGAIYEIVISK